MVDEGLRIAGAAVRVRVTGIELDLFVIEGVSFCYRLVSYVYINIYDLCSHDIVGPRENRKTSVRIVKHM